MSPEQASAEDVDHRADVFALGVVLWEALTGRRLFRRDTELATMRAIVDDPIPRPSELATVPPELEAITMRALRKRRDARFQSAHEMAVALERYAFAQAGFSPLQISSYMKGLFASECLQWRKTATAALDMEVDRSEEQHPSVAALATEAATMALRPGVPSGVSWTEGRASEARSAGSFSPARAHDTVSRASGATVPTQVNNRDRLWVYGGIAVLLGIVGAGAWMLTRPPAMSTTRHVLVPTSPEPASTVIVSPIVSPPALAPVSGPVVIPSPSPSPSPSALAPSGVTPATAGPAPAAPGAVAVPVVAAPGPATIATPGSSPAPTPATSGAAKTSTRATNKSKLATRGRAHKKGARGEAESNPDEKSPSESKPVSGKADPFAD
jgi:hypothetical protein